MKSYQQSLSNLFKAEEDANRTIRIAEEKRETILGQAIRDAEIEIESFKADKDKEFQNQVSKNTNNFQELDQQVADTRKTNEKEYNQHKDEVVDFLIDRIFNVEVQLERNVQKHFDKLLVNNQQNKA